MNTHVRRSPCRERVPRDEPRDVARPHPLHRRESEPVLERAPGGDPDRNRAGVGVRVAVRDQDERRAPDALDLEHGIPARRGARRTSSRPSAGTPRRPAALRRAARPSSSSRRTASPSKPRPAEKQKRRPFTEPSEIRRSRPSAIASPSCARRLDRIARHAERARQHARPAARQEARTAVRRRRRSAPRCTSRRPRRRGSRRPQSAAAAAASSVAWPGCWVNCVSRSTRSRSAVSTAVIRCAGDLGRVRVDDQQRASSRLRACHGAPP